MLFTLTMHAYCGMATPIEDGDRADVRIAAAQQLRMARIEHRPVTTLQRGARWEIGDRPDARMVSDVSGILAIANVAARCSECDAETDTDRRTLSAHSARFFLCSDCATDAARDADEYAGFDDRDDDGGPWSGGFADNH